MTATKFESATRGGRLFFPTADEILLSSIYSLPKIGRKLLSDIFIEVDAVIVANESDLQRKDNSAVERLLRRVFKCGLKTFSAFEIAIKIYKELKCT